MLARTLLYWSTMLAARTSIPREDSHPRSSTRLLEAARESAPESGARTMFHGPRRRRDEASLTETLPAPEREAVALAAGVVVAGRYRLERPIGEGSAGVVWEATHLGLARRVALKIVSQNDLDGHVRLQREARIACKLNHDNVVTVIDVFHDDASDAHVMVMDLLVGESLADRLTRGVLAPSDAARALLPVVSVLRAAHAAGVVHRDVKPEHVFFDRGWDGEDVVKLLDFGIAKTPASSARVRPITMKGAMMGTPHYMAPEQVFGEDDVDHRADLWALGVVLFEALTGTRPFRGATFGQIFKAIALGDVPDLGALCPTAPAELASLVARLLTKNRAERPSLDEVEEVLARLL